MCNIAWIVGFVVHVCIVDDIWQVLVFLDKVWIYVVAVVEMIMWIECYGGCVENNVCQCDHIFVSFPF